MSFEPWKPDQEWLREIVDKFNEEWEPSKGLTPVHPRPPVDWGVFLIVLAVIAGLWLALFVALPMLLFPPAAEEFFGLPWSGLVLAMIMTGIGVLPLYATRSTGMYRPPNTRRPPIAPHIRELIFERDGYRCKRCDTSTGLQVDHIIPWSKGGAHHPVNYQTLCSGCNMSKRARLLGMG